MKVDTYTADSPPNSLREPATDFSFVTYCFLESQKIFLRKILQKKFNEKLDQCNCQVDDSEELVYRDLMLNLKNNFRGF